MSVASELLDRIAAEMRDVRGRLERLRSSHPESAALTKALNLQEELSHQISDAKDKLGKHGHMDAEAEALAKSIQKGMEQMIAIISSDEESRSIQPGHPH